MSTFYSSLSFAEETLLTPNDPSIRSSTPVTPVFVTGNPLGSQALSSSTSAISGDALVLRADDSLGSTLNGLPGVSTSTYGPMVGRPMIRGMDGDRIRILQNGVAAFDASSLSYDHAVPIDPLIIDRVEIVRGPAALLYGGNAVGGVVNTIDNRIPREAVEGVVGEMSASYGGANSARAAAAKIEAGNGRFAFHVDAFNRETNNQRVPGFVDSPQKRVADGESASTRYGSIQNSDGRSHGGAVGGAYTWANGFTGLSYSGYESVYGSVAEADVRLRMRQERVAFASEIRELSGPFSQVKTDFAYTTYQHKEIQNGVTGTTFRNNGYEARVEARHKPIGAFVGTIGTQFSQNTFSTVGTEALVPTTRTTTAAIFGLEEWQANRNLTLSLGGRFEHVNLDPVDGVGLIDTSASRFQGARASTFNAGSLSFGALQKLSSMWSVAANVAYTERAPTFYELYANGPHVASNEFLIGNPAAQKEKAISTDLALRFESGPHKASVSVFYNRFANYLTQMNTGRTVDGDGHVEDDGDHDHDHDHAGHSHDDLTEAVYRGVRAEFYGVEMSGKWRVFQDGPHRVDLEAVSDYTHARDLDSGRPLPRISPLRATVAVDYRYGPFGVRGQIVHALAQHRVPENDQPTSHYTSLGLTVTYKFRLRSTHWLAYARGDNLSNQDIRYASSVVRDIAPQGGRSIMVGLRTQF